MSPQWVIAVISALAALISAVGSLYWGRDARQAAAREVQAKNAELQAKDALIANLERLSPKRLVEDVHGLMEIQDQLLVAAKQQAELQAQEKLAAFEKASGEEKKLLEAELQSSRQRIAELQTVKAKSDAINRRMVQIGDDFWGTDDDSKVKETWLAAVNDLPLKIRAYFREGEPKLEGNRLTFAIPYEFHYQAASENLDKIIPIARKHFDDPTLDVQLVLRERVRRKD